MNKYLPGIAFSPNICDFQNLPKIYKIIGTIVNFKLSNTLLPKHYKPIEHIFVRFMKCIKRQLRVNPDVCGWAD